MTTWFYAGQAVFWEVRASGARNTTAALSIAAARLAKSSGSRWLYTFMVVVTFRWPKSFETVTTDAPDASANDPAV